MPSTLSFDNRELLPEAWSFLRNGPLWCFNPGLQRLREEFLLAYRLVGHDGQRRIGACLLDKELRIVRETITPLSDLLRIRPKPHYPPQASGWFADPRLVELQGRLYLHWNSGWHETENQQFLQELAPSTLAPKGEARELVLQGGRNKIEKNWMLFESEGVYAVYSVAPHRVLKAHLDADDDILLEDTASTDWATGPLPGRIGELRGGTPPVAVDGCFHAFCHSVCDTPAGYKYTPSAYVFSAQAPFIPLRRPKTALPLPNERAGRNILPRLNPGVGEVVYPCGAVFEKTSRSWLISYGVNDERCAIARLSQESLLESTEPLQGTVAAP